MYHAKNKMLIIGETGCEEYGNCLYYLCNFSVNLKISKKFIIERQFGGAWMAQPVKCPTLHLSSGLDLRIVSSSPMVAGRGSLIHTLSLNTDHHPGASPDAKFQMLVSD